MAYLELKKSLEFNSGDGANNPAADSSVNSQTLGAATGAEGTPAPRPPLTEKEKEKLKKSIEPYMFFEDPDQLMKPTTAYLTTS